MSSAYCTQVDQSGRGGYRCGPAVCASVLLSEGWQSDPWGLTQELDRKVDPTQDGTTSYDLLQLMGEYGFSGWLWDDWTVLPDMLRDGFAVLLLNTNWRLVPRPYPSGAGWNAMHWIRIVARTPTDDMLYIYDPLTYLAQPDGTIYQGPTVATRKSCKAAGDATGYREYGVYFVSPSGKDLNTGG